MGVLALDLRSDPSAPLTATSVRTVTLPLPPLITLQAMTQELNTELSYRKHVYSRLVSEGKMTQATADRRMNILAAIIFMLQPGADFERAEAAAAKEAAEPRLL